MDSIPRARAYVSTPFETDSLLKWRDYAERWEEGHPVVAGHYADLVEQAVIVAAKFDGAWNRDLRPLVAWLKAGIDPDLVIVPAIRRVAARGNYPTPPPASLNYFDPMIRRQGVAA